MRKEDDSQELLIQCGSDLSYVLKKIETLRRFSNEYPRLFAKINATMATRDSDLRVIYIIKDTLDATEISNLSEEEIKQVLIDWLLALHVLHSNGFLHGHIVPRSLRIVAEDTPSGTQYHGKLSLYGASFLNPKITLPIQYRPPESMFEGLLDARSDLYNLGIVLFEIFTGRNPFDHFNRNVIKSNVLNGITSKIEDLNPSIPQIFASQINKLVAFRKSQRPKDAKEVLIQLGGKAEFENTGQITYYPDFNDYVKSLTYITHKVKERHNANKPTTILISGGSGVGKTAYCNAIASTLTKEGFFHLSVNFFGIHWYQVTYINLILENFRAKFSKDELRTIFGKTGLLMIEKSLDAARRGIASSSITNYKIWTLLQTVVVEIAKHYKISLVIDNAHLASLQQQLNILRLLSLNSPNLCLILSVDETTMGGQRVLGFIQTSGADAPLRIDLRKITPEEASFILSRCPITERNIPRYNENIEFSRLIRDLAFLRIPQDLEMIGKNILSALGILGNPLPLHVLHSMFRSEAQADIDSVLIYLEKQQIVKTIYIEEEGALGVYLTHSSSRDKTHPLRLEKVESLSIAPSSDLWRIYVKMKVEQLPDISEIERLVKNYLRSPFASFAFNILDQYYSHLTDNSAIRIKYWMGVIAFNSGESSLAASYLSDVVLEDTSNALTREEAVWALLTASWLRFREKDTTRAEPLLQEALDIIGQEDEELARFQALLAFQYFFNGKIKEAWRLIEEALSKKIRKLSEANLEANAVAGILSLYLGDYSQAYFHFNEAYEIAHALQRFHDEAWIRRNTATALIAIDPKEAVNRINEALDTYAAIGTLRDVSITLNNKAMVLFQTGIITGMLETAKEAYKLVKALNSRLDLMDPADTYSLALLVNGKFEESLDYSEEALVIAREYNEVIGLIEVGISNIIIRYLGGYDFSERLNGLKMLQTVAAAPPFGEIIKGIEFHIANVDPSQGISYLIKEFTKGGFQSLSTIYEYLIAFFWFMNLSKLISRAEDPKKIIDSFVRAGVDLKILCPNLKIIIKDAAELLSSEFETRSEFHRLYKIAPSIFIKYAVAMFFLSLGEKSTLPILASILQHCLNNIPPGIHETFLKRYVENTALEEYLPKTGSFVVRISELIKQYLQ